MPARQLPLFGLAEIFDQARPGFEEPLTAEALTRAFAPENRFVYDDLGTHDESEILRPEDEDFLAGVAPASAPGDDDECESCQ